MIGENRMKKGSGLVITRGQNCPVSVDLVAGIDAGSTETRISLATAEDAQVFMDPNRTAEALEVLGKTYVIPSTYAMTGDNREILPASDNLEDNYDSTIMSVRVGAERPMLTRHRILRGRKMRDASGLVARYLDSSTNKSDNPIFYTNIIDALGYSVLQKFNGAVPSEVKVQMFLSVRPKELTSQCRKKMLDNLVGQFIFAWKDISITINISGVEFSTEPEAQVFGTTTVYDLRYSVDPAKNQKYKDTADRMYDARTYIHIEGGGSSIGVEVVRDTQLVDSCSSTFQLGGNYLCQVFIDRLREVLGRTATMDSASEALMTTLLRDGREAIDVDNIVADCKNQVALDIVERLRHNVIDLNHWLQLQDVEFISLGGRLFRPDEHGNTISEYLEEYIHQISPNTDIVVLEENHIPQGNLAMAVNNAIEGAFFTTTTVSTPAPAEVPEPATVHAGDYMGDPEGEEE